MLNTLEILVLAAGKGTRMHSNISKVLQPVCEKPLIHHLLKELAAFAKKRGVLQFNFVVGFDRESVEKEITSYFNAQRISIPFKFSVQAHQNGTGHAVACALKNLHPKTKDVFVINGDLPLWTLAASEELLNIHAKNKAAASLASMDLKEPGHYGRILKKAGKFIKIVESKDASIAELRVSEVNGGVYVFDRVLLEKFIGQLKSNNKAGEIYLTDFFEKAAKGKKKIQAHCVPDPNVLYGVNTFKELAYAQKTLYRRTAEYWMQQGVCIWDPEQTYIGSEVQLAAGVEIKPFTFISGKTKIAAKAKIGSLCELRNVQVGEGTVIKNSCSAEDSEIGQECSIGPMAHLRKGTKLSDRVHLGNFVELKQASLGEGSKASHLSYIGDAQIGSDVNIGCGFVTCNYDGVVRNGERKHRTKIGNDVFIGSDCQVVAPIEIADGTFIASGSTVTESVKNKDSLVVARSRQTTKPGYAKKYKAT